jgi:hypothetical protein
MEQFGGADIPVCRSERADKNVCPTKLDLYAARLWRRVFILGRIPLFPRMDFVSF